MAQSLSRRGANWNEIKTSPFASVSTNFTKMGRAMGTDVITSAATDLLIVSTAHGLSDEAFFMLAEGGEESEPRHVTSSTADVLTLGEVLSGTPSAGESFSALNATAVDLCESTTTDTILKATGHVAVVGDLVWMTAGGEIGEPRVVASIAATTITLDAALSGTPSAGEGFATATPSVIGGIVDASTTDTIILDTAHVAVVGDIFMMTTGGEIDEPRIVIAQTAGVSFTLNEALSGTPTAAETYNLYTPTLVADVEAGNSDTKLFATAHTLIVGDQFTMITGGEDGEGREIAAAGTDWFSFTTALSGSPSVTETFAGTRPLRQTAEKGAVYGQIHNHTNQGVQVSFDGVTVHHHMDASENWNMPSAVHGLYAIEKGDEDGKGWVWLRTNQVTPPTSGSVHNMSAT